MAEDLIELACEELLGSVSARAEFCQCR